MLLFTYLHIGIKLALHHQLWPQTLPGPMQPPGPVPSSGSEVWTLSAHCSLHCGNQSVTCDSLRNIKLMSHIQFRRLVLKSPPLGCKWGKCATKLGCASSHTSSLHSLQSVAAGRMRTRVFLHTYPTYALVWGASRPAGETVHLFPISCRS